MSAPPTLTQALPRVVEASARGPVVLIAPPGAGKTTLVPPALLDGGVEGRILVLQPRRVATRAAARRVAHLRGGRVGDEIGYRVRFERKVSAKTRVEFLTEGLLTRMLQADPFLEGVGAVLIDEFHERSLHADLALALLKEVLAEARPDLRLIVMSATLDPGPVAGFLDAEVIEVAGRQFPVEVRHDLHVTDHGPIQRCPGAVRRIFEETGRGDLLVFLPGRGEIARVGEALRDLDAEVLPLHGGLSAAEQDRALSPNPKRKVVLATNIAETSLTLEGVVAVIDTGLARVPTFDPAIGLTRLELRPISHASADQRAGRAGRVGPGLCHRLWTAHEHRGRLAALPPEIARADLASTYLELKAWGVEPEGFALLERPSDEAWAEARATLTRIGCLDEEGALTPAGEASAALPVEPRLARVLLAGRDHGQAYEAAGLAALLSERDLFTATPPFNAGCDLTLRLEILERDRPGAGVDRRAHASARQIRAQLLRLIRGGASSAAAISLPELLMAGFPERVGRRRAPRGERFQLASGRGARLSPDSVVREAPWIIAVVLEGAKRGARAEHLIRVATEIDPDLLPTTINEEIRFDAEREAVEARRVERFMALEISARPTKGDPTALAEALAAAVAPDPIRAFKPDEAALNLLRRLRFAAAHKPELGLPRFEAVDHPSEVVDPLLIDLCMGRRRFEDLRRINLAEALRARLGYLGPQLDALAPRRLKLPGGRMARVEYQVEGPPILAARIQQCFGWKETPRIAGAPVLLHLLAPNGRPAQITQDLAGFWETSYALVRKDLRGRYPKHAWPEDPKAL